MAKTQGLVVSIAMAVLMGGFVATIAQGGPPPLPAGQAASGQTLAQTKGCVGCHGPGGVSTNPATPRLAGQVPSYLGFQLVVLRGGQRPSPVMNAVAKNLSDQEIADLVAYFSSQSIGPAWPSSNADLRKKGEALFQAGDVKRDQIACAICHGADGRGVNGNGIASIANQSPDYFNAVMNEFGLVSDFGVPPPNAMHIVMSKLNVDDLKALAEYIKGMQ